MESSYVEKGEYIPDPVESPAGKIGMSICYDMRFPELSLALAKKGAEILTYPSAFTFATGANHWETLLRARAIETQCYVVAAAQTGSHNPKRTSWGHAMVVCVCMFCKKIGINKIIFQVDPWGQVIAQCTEGVGIAIAPINLDYVKKVRRNLPVYNHRRTDLYPDIVAKRNDESEKSEAFYPFGQVSFYFDKIL